MFRTWCVNQFQSMAIKQHLVHFKLHLLRPAEQQVLEAQGQELRQCNSLFHSLPSAWPVESTSRACSPSPCISLWSVSKKKLTRALAFLSFWVQAWQCQNKQTNKQITYWDEMTWLFYFVLHHWNIWKWTQVRIVGVRFSFLFWYEKILGLKFLNEEKKREKRGMQEHWGIPNSSLKYTCILSLALICPFHWL